MAAGETEKLVESLGEDALDAGITNVDEAASTESLENTGEDITEAVVESLTSAALASTGIGIFLAVGIDAIFGAFNGVKEQDELQDLLSQLDDKMSIVNAYLETANDKYEEINKKTVDGISTFQKWPPK